MQAGGSRPCCLPGGGRGGGGRSAGVSAASAGMGLGGEAGRLDEQTHQGSACSFYPSKTEPGEDFQKEPREIFRWLSGKEFTC